MFHKLNKEPWFRNSSYTLLADGQRDDVIEKRYDGSGSTPTSTTKIDWSYDALNRLTREVRDEGNDGVQNGGDYSETYAFSPSNIHRPRQFGHGTAQILPRPFPGQKSDPGRSGLISAVIG
ncbi:MAG: hypothetical protein IT447_15530 [Phycisphaerales bacterium]|jgi:hypothetical protein|nr:hypothetical protein [Phycisphaerales bacterium]